MRPDNHAVGFSHLHLLKNNINRVKWEKLTDTELVEVCDKMRASVDKLYQIFASESGEAVKQYEANRKQGSPDA